MHLHSRRVEKRTSRPPARPRDAAKWIPAATVLIALSTALLWFRGWVYRNALLDEWGIDAAMFPVDWHVMVSSGGLQTLSPALAVCMYAMVGLTTFAMLLTLIPGPILRDIEARFRSSELSSRVTLHRWFLVAFFVIAGATVIAFLFAFQGVVHAYQAGKDDAQATLTSLAVARCEPVATQKKLAYARIERRVLLADGKEGITVDEGYPVACTEKHCALLQLPTRHSWRAIIVPLDKVNRFESYGKVQPAADCL